ncbi:MAG: hypothetical protein WB689_19025 [Xanthobacteraceae bacterium]
MQATFVVAVLCDSAERETAFHAPTASGAARLDNKQVTFAIRENLAMPAADMRVAAIVAL